MTEHHGKACERCAAWEPLRPKAVGPSTQGRCRREPPSDAGRWPLTGPQDWCLAFEPQTGAGRPAFPNEEVR